jgi:hypothetical protein
MQHTAALVEMDDVGLRQFPETFSVPTRYVKHMMVVADLARGDAGAIEDAIEAAWQLQHRAERGRQPLSLVR